MSRPRAEDNARQAPRSLSWEAGAGRRHVVDYECVLTSQRSGPVEHATSPRMPVRGRTPNRLSISGSCHARTVRRDSRNSTLSDRWRRRVLLYSRPSTPLHRRLQRTAGDGSPAQVGGWRPAPPREDEGLAPPPARVGAMRVPRPPWTAAEIRASPPSWRWPRASRSPPAPGRPPSAPSARRAAAPWRSGT